MNHRKAFSTLAAAVLLALAAPAAQAWDGIVTGRVTMTEITHGDNMGYRVYLGGTAMCTTGHSWAFLQASESNYKVYVAEIMLAKARNTPVTIFSYIDGGTGRYCHIGHLVAHTHPQ